MVLVKPGIWNMPELFQHSVRVNEIKIVNFSDVKIPRNLSQIQM